MNAYWPSLIGGMLLGLSAIALLLLDGRIAGISGIVGRLLGGQVPLNAAFVIGLMSGPPLYRLAFGSFPFPREDFTPSIPRATNLVFPRRN